jgi:imidazolonepropionase-like amidohydrolase
LTGKRQADSFFTNCRIVNTDTGLTTGPQTVRVSDGVITDIDAGRPGPGPGVTDIAGRYLLPGFISCHTHLQAQFPYSLRSEREPAPLTALRAAHRARQALMAGITTIRCVHEQSRADLTVRAASAAGWAMAPRILGAGRALTVAGGHGDGLGCAVAAGHDGFRAAAAEELGAGADHVKIFLTGGLARADEPIDELQMEPAEIAGAVSAAESQGTYVVAHAASGAAIRAGLAAGVRSFEHGYRLDSETARQIADAGAFLTPTMVVTQVTGWMESRGLDPASVARSLAAREQHVAGAQAAIAAHVRIVNGTDFPPADLDDDCPLFVREAELLVSAGLTPLQSIQAATLTPADLLGLTGRLGKIAAGYQADMIALPADPTQDITALRDIRVVIAGGEIIRSS